MNYRMILKSIGAVLCIEAACMLPSLGVSLLYKEIEVLAFILSILIISVIGLSLLQLPPQIRQFTPVTALPLWLWAGFLSPSWELCLCPERLHPCCDGRRIRIRVRI